MVDGERCYLTDFGLTKQTISTSASLTATGVFLGTPDYAAPEQIEAGGVDARADVYALAGMLHECLTGAKPYPRDTPVAVLYAQLRDPPPRPSEIRPGLPRAFDHVIARGMAKRPEHRPGTCAELLHDARVALSGVPDDRPTAQLPQPPPVAATGPTRAARPVATVPGPDRDATHPLPATASPPPLPPVRRTRRRAVAPLLGLAFAGALIGAVVLVAFGGGGSDESGGSGDPSVQPRVAGAPILVGQRPFGVVFADGALWVANNSGGTVTRAPVEGGEPQTIDVGGEPFWLARAGDAIWVANAGSDSVVPIDIASGRVGASVDVGPSPYFIATDDSSLFVSNGAGNTVSVLDADTGEPAGEPIRVGDQPRGVAVTPEGVWVASRTENSVSRIRGGDIDELPVGRNPVGVTAGGGAVWVANEQSNTVSRIQPGDDDAQVKTIRVGREPFALAFGEGFVWVTNSGEDTVMRLDPETGAVVGKPIDVPGQPVGITVAEGSVWVTSNDANSVVRIDPEP